MRTIRHLVQANLQVPTSTFYDSEPWFLFSKDKILFLLENSQGNRELFNDVLYDDAYKLRTDEDIVQVAEDTIKYIMVMNSWKYKHLYDIYCAEYNPIWNVDGVEKETIEREKDNTGTQATVGSGHDDLEYQGKESNTKSGSETQSPSGSETLTKAGSIHEVTDSDDQSKRTTFDSNTDYNTDKLESTIDKVTSYGRKALDASDPYTETTTYTNRQDSHTYNNVTDERSFTGRKDVQTYGKTDTRTDNLNEKENTVITRERGGNIGVTMTQQLMEAEMNIAHAFKFFEVICRDIADAISYI